MSLNSDKLNGVAGPPLPPAHCSAQPRKFYWAQCYEMDDGKVHWALRDTHTDAEPPPSRVTCGTMVLECHAPKYFSRPLDAEYWPKLIVELLNAHFAPNDQAQRLAANNPKI